MVLISHIAKEPEDEFARALKGQRERMESKSKEAEKAANMTELERKFVSRRNIEAKGP